MKKLIIFIIVIAISIFVGYKSYNIVNKSKQFKNDRIGQFMRPDVIGEIESISENEITLKVIKSPNFNKNNEINSTKEEFKIEYTGEKKKITICSDIKIFKKTVAEKGMQESEIKLLDLNVGDVLSLMYKDDKSSIYKIVLN